MRSRFTIKDDTFVDLGVAVGNYVYLSQESPETGERPLLTLTPDGAYRLGLELVRRCQPKNGGSVQ